MEIIEGKVCPYPIHFLTSIPRYTDITLFVGTLKSKSTLKMFPFAGLEAAICNRASPSLSVIWSSMACPFITNKTVLQEYYRKKRAEGKSYRYSPEPFSKNLSGLFIPCKSVI